MKKEISFAQTVGQIMDQAKKVKGGVNRLCEVTGKKSAILSQWRRGVYAPKSDERVAFLRKSTALLKEMATEREKHERESQDLLKEVGLWPR
ncbi:hypothetical protein [Dyadobacter sp. BHUBP1]|uniref:hypothetical protein n=1 Tax=Dyadobacter sp. BHUBP1 TaxID=3424178 RepID=UPI003D33AC6C